MPENVIIDARFDVKKIPTKFYEGLCRLFYQLGINGNDVIDDFIYAYIDHAHQQSHKRTDIYSATGFGRKFVNNYFNNITFKSNPQISKNHQTLIGALQMLFNQSDNGLIKIRGKHNSFNSAFNLVRSPNNNISAQAMLNKFIRVGIVEKVGETHIKLISTLPETGLNDPDDIIRLLTDNMNRLCHTLIHNLNAIDNKETLVQSSYWSNSIDTKYKKNCTDELREQTRLYLKNCSRIIDKYEHKGAVIKKTEAQATELGVSAFVFNNPK